MLRRLRLIAIGAALVVPGAARADAIPHGASVVRLLGPHAESTLAPNDGRIGALVAIPPGTTAAALGVDEIAPGIGRLRARASTLLAFAAAHPGVHMEVSPPLHRLLDKAGEDVNAGRGRLLSNVDGTGALVGVVDTGLDVTHPDFIDAAGKSRVAWILDLSLPPVGLYPDLERKFGIKDEKGNVAFGAVFAGSDIDRLRATPNAQLPGDESGHGTHVTGIAAGNGGASPHTKYVGMAPGAQIVFARAAVSNSESFGEDDVVLGVKFLFDRADSMRKPIAVNLSLGTTFGPHDGTLLWEQTLASMVGPDHPGRALVVAAGNSGSIVETPTHQSVHVTEGTRVRVAIRTQGATNGGVQTWVTMRPGADIQVGLEAPDGEWIAPVARGDEKGRNQDGYNAGVLNGTGNDIPKSSHSALVLWSGRWPAGTYFVTLEGTGTADLYVQGTGDAEIPGVKSVEFLAGVREGTVNIPATHPGIIAVGCTVSKPRWQSIADPTGPGVKLRVPVLDPRGGLPDPGGTLRDLEDGEECYFSSAGPTVSGVPKPEISAPGAVIASTMSKQATPGTPGGLFTDPSCPPVNGVADKRCLQVDPTHAVSAGTSMSAPMVTGAVALLFQKNPTLTQSDVMMLLQAGAHPFRTAAVFQDQGGPGELDVQGSLDALDQMANPKLLLPAREKSWMTFSADYVAADESTPLTAIVELRAIDPAHPSDQPHRADLFDASRLSPYVLIDGRASLAPQIVRRGPGVWYMTILLPRGMGGSSFTLGVRFDGEDIVDPHTLPIGTDIWTADYPSHAKGGCVVARDEGGPASRWGLACVAIAVAFGARRRLRRG